MLDVDLAACMQACVLNNKETAGVDSMHTGSGQTRVLADAGL